MIYAEEGLSATIMVRVSFEDTSVAAGCSGGAVYAGGSGRAGRQYIIIT